jgi:hypothetical protein
MNRTKHMKHKKNTRLSHKLRKPRNTHKRYKKYNRCRTRSQRGGWITKEQVFKTVLNERLDAYKESIPSEFHNYETFLNFYSVYGASDLEHVVCGNFSDGDIRLNENTKLSTIKQLLETLKKTQELTNKQTQVLALLNNPSFKNKWTNDFVISLKQSVDTRHAKISAIEIQKRKELAARDS